MSTMELAVLGPLMVKLLTLTAVLTGLVALMRTDLPTFLFRGWVMSAVLVLLYQSNSDPLVRLLSGLASLLRW